MGDEEFYGYRGVAVVDQIGFGPLKGPERGNLVQDLAYAENELQYVVDATGTLMCGLTWTSAPAEYVDAGVTVTGIASVDMDVRVEFTRGEDFTVSHSFLTQAKAGVPTLISTPWIVDLAPAGTWRWRMRVRTSVGTFTIAPGDARWFIERSG